MKFLTICFHHSYLAYKLNNVIHFIKLYTIQYCYWCIILYTWLPAFFKKIIIYVCQKMWSYTVIPELFSSYNKQNNMKRVLEVVKLWYIKLIIYLELNNKELKDWYYLWKKTKIMALYYGMPVYLLYYNKV